MYLIAWLFVGCLCGLMALPWFRTRYYAIPAVSASVFVLLLVYPYLARRMHQRKLTYEDLEDLRDADSVLRHRFQVVFTRVQQVGGAICAGMLTLYGFHVFEHQERLTAFEIVGVLGGLLSRYERVYGYIGGLCIACLYRLKRVSAYESQRAARASAQGDPHAPKPEETQ